MEGWPSGLRRTPGKRVDSNVSGVRIPVPLPIEYFMSNVSDYIYHHIGIPTDIPQMKERYSKKFKMYSSYGDNQHRIQWHRFEDDCPLHPLIKTVPHVAFKVKNLDKAIEGKNVILEPYSPFKDFKVAMVEIDGAPVEYIETSLSEQEIWNVDRHKDSVIY